jgi:hypothetical protein
MLLLPCSRIPPRLLPRCVALRCAAVGCVALRCVVCVSCTLFASPVIACSSSVCLPTSSYYQQIDHTHARTHTHTHTHTDLTCARSRLAGVPMVVLRRLQRAASAQCAWRTKTRSCHCRAGTGLALDAGVSTFRSKSTIDTLRWGALGPSAHLCFRAPTSRGLRGVLGLLGANHIVCACERGEWM